DRFHPWPMPEAIAYGTDQARFPVSGAAMRPTLDPEALETLAGLTDEASRAQFFDVHDHLAHEAVVEQLAEAVRERVHVNVQQAAALSEAAIVLAGRVTGDETMARALRARANAHRYTHEFQRAVELFDEAARLFERGGNRAEV